MIAEKVARVIVEEGGGRHPTGAEEHGIDEACAKRDLVLPHSHRSAEGDAGPREIRLRYVDTAVCVDFARLAGLLGAIAGEPHPHIVDHHRIALDHVDDEHHLATAVSLSER